MAGVPHAAFERIMAIVQFQDVVEIPVGGGRVALLDKADEHLVAPHKWTSTSRYARARIDGRIVMMHRLIMAAPDGLYVDHEDGDGFNNQRYNLRFCTHAENMRNRKSASGTSRFKGVYFAKGSWRAQIAVAGTKHRLGTFTTERKAAKAYDKAALELHGAFAKTNAVLGLY